MVNQDFLNFEILTSLRGDEGLGLLNPSPASRRKRTTVRE